MKDQVQGICCSGNWIVKDRKNGRLSLEGLAQIQGGEWSSLNQEGTYSADSLINQWWGSFFHFCLLHWTGSLHSHLLFHLSHPERLLLHDQHLRGKRVPSSLSNPGTEWLLCYTHQLRVWQLQWGSLCSSSGECSSLRYLTMMGTGEAENEEQGRK